MRDILYFDIETFSECDLIKSGSSRYARHPSTEVLMISYAINDEPVKTWDAFADVGVKTSPLAYRQRFRAAMPRLLLEALDDPEVDKSGWNVGQFERPVLAHVLGFDIPVQEWSDTMVLSLTCSMPGKLELALQAAGFDEEDQKFADGKSLIKYFSTPRKPTKKRLELRNLPKHDPQKWERYLDYNWQDVNTERRFKKEFADFELPSEERDLWNLDQTINDRGIPINLDMVDNALRLINLIQGKLHAQMVELTGLENPNSGEQLLPWLREGGYLFQDLKKGHVARAIDDWKKRRNMDRKTLAVLKLRQQAAKASVKKYQALKNATDVDGNLRFALQFSAAGRTWRWGGRKYQPQNLARPHPKLEKKQEEVALDITSLGSVLFMEKYGPLAMDALSTGVRPVVQAEDGEVFIDVDLNAIENRVLGYLADDYKILDVFLQGRDPYVSFACDLYNSDYETLFKEYKSGDKKKRTIAKPGVLGCGYMLGPGEEYEDEQTGEIEATGLLGYAWNMQVREFTIEDSIKSVEVWRRTFRKAVKYWYEVHDAAFECVATGRTTYHKDVEFRMRGEFMELWLPSERALKYHLPKIQKRKTPWGEMRDQITYMNLNDRNQWIRVSTHPGKVTENIDQAFSRDLLAHGMTLAEAEGIKIRVHVHDQIVASVKERDAEARLKILIACMETKPWWAKTIPLKAEGSINKFFVKG